MSKRELLRHTVATLAYRGGKAIRGAPVDFAAFRAKDGARTAVEILAHIGDLLDWAEELTQGRHTWRSAPAGSWQSEVTRFFGGLERFDARLASDAPLGTSERKLFQGPIADALAHVGQIAMLRRLFGAPVRGENYLKADIEAGRVGPDQPPPHVEFD